MPTNKMAVELRPYGKSWDVFTEGQRIGHVRARAKDGLLLVFCFGRRIGHVKGHERFMGFCRYVLYPFKVVPTLQEAIALMFEEYRRLVVNLGEEPDPELARRYAEGQR
ncbi:hypothetical protein [Polyangium mundeleinium]|uniref:Uncharacterized protein n=1 Tax=Polyangium mundeleinium TaxID=2995306 RepID=A0ABT5F7G7_9BACT|nr:hypothetical protein [Polyangium mundeleinium]MDC0750047.1 hypothetical protein [Polyangium mundeleinium]